MSHYSAVCMDFSHKILYVVDLGKRLFKCLDSMVFDIYFYQERKLQSNSVDCGVLHLKQGKIFE